MEQKLNQNPKLVKKEEQKLVRILSKDIEGNLSVYVGLTKIKGISWSVSNAICKILGINKSKKIGDLTKEEIDKINNFSENPNLPPYLVNRRNDRETGKNKHLVGSHLELQGDLDLGRLKKIKSYKGIRHSLGLPVRGQRTKSHFRKNRRKSVGIKKKGVKT
jgi:small subunit ribosomal protein S13